MLLQSKFNFSKFAIMIPCRWKEVNLQGGCPPPPIQFLFWPKALMHCHKIGSRRQLYLRPSIAIDGTPSWMVTFHWVRFPRPRWSVIYFLEPYTNLEAATGRNCINTEKNGHTIWIIFLFSFISRTTKSFSPSLPISIFSSCSAVSSCRALIVAQLSPHQIHVFPIFFFHSRHFYLLCINCGTIINAPCRYTGWYSNSSIGKLE